MRMQRLAGFSAARRQWRRCTLVFFLAACAGWAYEVILYLLDGKGWVNRGFLHGPYLPIYGFGAVLMLLALQALTEQPDLVFLLGAALSGAVEWLTGEALWALYAQRWWDYTGYPYQIRGFVCLHSVLVFGLGGLIVIYRLRPAVDRWLDALPGRTADALCLAMTALPALDFVATLCLRHALV